MNRRNYLHLIFNWFKRWQFNPLLLALLGLMLMGGKFLFIWAQHVDADHACSDPVAIVANTSWNTDQCHGDVTVTAGAILTIAGGVTADLTSLTLGDGITNGFITAQGNTGTGLGVTINLDANLDIKSGSSISANSQGFGNSAGTGAALGATGGGAHGGMGGGTNGGTATYGTAVAPITLGSGGEGAASIGGGAVKIEVGGDYIAGGNITANGGGGVNGDGGGAGGSIWLDFVGGASTWSGAGQLTANGGLGGTTGDGGGGGGRVAVTGYVTDTHSGTVSANGGTPSATNGAAGTVLTRSSAQTVGRLTITGGGSAIDKYARIGVTPFVPDQLTLSSNGRLEVPASTALTLPSGGNLSTASGSRILNRGTVTLPTNPFTLAFTYVHRSGTLSPAAPDITVASGAALVVDGAATFGNITVQSGGFLTHSDNSTAETFKTDVTVPDLTVDSGGLVDVNNLGFDGSQGTGSSGTAGNGASHGGHGGGTNTANPYGSAIAPVTIGSGGENGDAPATNSRGGGAVKVTVTGNFTNNGTIRANGDSSGSNTNGGGSGGSIWINMTGGSSSWSGNGAITANGGNASTGGTGGGGAGGRVAITGYVSDSHSGTPTANGGTGDLNAAAGTVYTKSSSQTNGALLVSNNSNTPQSGKYTRSNVTPLTLSSLSLSSSGTYEIPSGSLTVASGGTTTISSGSTMLNSGTFTSTGSTDSITGTYIANGTNTMGSVTVNSGGNITHSDNTTAETFKLTITADSMTVASGGTINTNGLGYDGADATQTAGSGPGAGGGGGNSSSSGGGAGHGGAGGKGGPASGGAGGSTYDSASAPVNIGSGGGGGASPGGAGGNGGGAVRLIINTNISVSGSITANGSDATASTALAHGGGSGGAVYITASGNLTCSSNTITANGGNGSNGSTQGGGGGGGGRVRLAISGTVSSGCGQANGGTKGTGGSVPENGVAGTVSLAIATPTMNAASNITTTAIRWNWTDQSTNETQFKLRDGSNSVIQTISSTTTGTTGTAYNFTESPLTVNTQYTRHVVASDGVEDSAASSQLNVYTLANTPGTPTLSSITSTGLTLTINVNSNPAATQFALYSVTTDQYVQANGSLGASAVWQTNTTWGGASGKSVTGLTPNTQYTFAVKARNGDNVETALSSTAAARTLAAVPNAPSLSSISSTGITVTFTVNGNPASTQFAIRESNSSNFVQTNGTLGATEVWRTHSEWGGITGQAVTGLTPNTEYTFAVKARNADNVETAFSSSTSATTDANTPGTPTVTALSSTSLNVLINVNGNSAATEFAIRENSGQFVQANGTLGGSTVWQTFTNWGAGSGKNVTGLSVNTQYTFSVKARDLSSTETPLSTTAARYTLANVPNTPTLGTVTTTAMTVTFTVNSNPAATQFAIFESNSGNFVQTDGTLSGSTVWQTHTNWGAGSGKAVTGLTAGTTYTFAVKARNGENVETALTSSASDTTLATVPTVASLTATTSNTLSIVIGENGNGSSVQYAIFEPNLSRYVQSDGTLNTGAVWQTFSQWGGGSGQSISSLSTNTQYTFQIKARNATPTETAFSSTLARYTLAIVPGAPVIDNVAAASLDLTITSNGNNVAAEFAIFESNTNKFVQSDKSLGDTVTWQTIATWGSSIIITPLSQGTEYTFAVKARNGENVETALSQTTSATTLSDSIAAPIMTTPTDITDDSVTWHWIDTTTNETSFVLRNSGFLIATIPSTTVSTSGTEYAYTETGLSPNTRPVRRIHAVNNGQESPASEEVGVFTLAAKPGTPRSVDVRNSSVVLILGENSNSDATEYAIFETTTQTYIGNNNRPGSSSPAWKGFRGITNGWGGVNGVRISNLEANRSYSFIVKARNNNLIETDFSDSVTATTYQAPDRPRWLDPTDVTSNAITWNWEDRSTTETRFHLTNSANSIFYLITSNTTASENTRYSYREENLLPNTEYVRRLTAFDGNNDGPFTTNRRYTHANVPGAPTISDITDTTASIAINTNQNPDYTAYAIYNVDHLSYVKPKAVKVDAGSGATKRVLTGVPGRSCRGRQIINGIPRDLCVEFWRSKGDWEKDGPSKLKLTGLLPDTEYTYATRAKNRIGEKTGFSERVTFRTAPRQTPVAPEPIIRFPLIPRLPSCIILCGSKLAVEFNPPPGSYTGPTEIEISYTPRSHQAQIRFTKDKSEPRLVYSPKYVNKILLTETGIIKARAFGSESDIIEASYTINPEEDPEQTEITVEATPSGGDYNQPVVVTLTPSTPATILYTTDGSDPRNSDLIYTGPITISSSAVLMFVAQDEDGNFGPMGEEQYNLTSEPDFMLITWPEPPESDLPAGTTKEDVVYEVKCGEEVIGTTTEPTFTDTSERPNGCDYTIVAKTKDSKEIGTIEPTSITSKPADIPSTKPNILERAAVLAPTLTVGLGVAAGALALAFGGTPSLPWINVLAWRKKRKPWGKIVNAATREGVPGVRIQLFDIAAYNRLVDQTVSDKEGRYGFVVKPGQYKIQVKQSGFAFPSTLDASGYRGQSFTVAGSSIVNTDISVDPAIPRRTVWQSLRKSARRLSFLRVPFLVAGTFFSVFNILVTVSLLNAVFVAYYIIMVILEIRNRNVSRRLTPILNAAGKPIPYAVVRVLNDQGQVIATKVANDEGRVYLLVPQGTYQAEIISPASSAGPATRSQLTLHLTQGTLSAALKAKPSLA